MGYTNTLSLMDCDMVFSMFRDCTCISCTTKGGAKQICYEATRYSDIRVATFYAPIVFAAVLALLITPTTAQSLESDKLLASSGLGLKAIFGGHEHELIQVCVPLCRAGL